MINLCRYFGNNCSEKQDGNLTKPKCYYSIGRILCPSFYKKYFSAGEIKRRSIQRARENLLKMTFKGMWFFED